MTILGAEPHADRVNELDRAADLFAVGELPETELSMVAAEALARGLDSPALVELACRHRTDTRDAAALFRTAMAELGLVADLDAAWTARESSVRRLRVGMPAEMLRDDDDLS